jgi:hypothetical protein
MSANQKRIYMAKLFFTIETLYRVLKTGDSGKPKSFLVRVQAKIIKELL